MERRFHFLKIGILENEIFENGNAMNISQEDLRFFIALWEKRSITLAAQELNLTLPTASRRVARLKEIFGDPCFIRTPQGLIPTSLATEVIGDVLQANAKLMALSRHRVFDPKTLKRIIRIACPDNAVPYLLAPVVKAINEEAPQCTLAFSFSDFSSFENLQKGVIDFVIRPKALGMQGYHYLPLHVFEQVLVVRRDHPLVEIFDCKGKIDVADLEPYGRVLNNISLINNPEEDYSLNYYDRHFSTDKNIQKTNVISPYFLGSIIFAEKSDLTVTMPRETAEFVAERNPNIAILPYPTAKQGSIVTCLFWHDRVHNDPAMQWVRSQFKLHAQTESGALFEQKNRF